jgi:hypothetical protein
MNKELQTLTAEKLKEVTGGLTPLTAASLPSLQVRSDLYSYFRYQDIYRIAGSIGHW